MVLKRALFSLATAILILGSQVEADIVTVSSVFDDSGAEISRWSDTATAKSLDIDGDNYYGTDGYFWVNSSGSGSPNTNVFANSIESVASYVGGIAFAGTAGTGNGRSGSFSGADDRLAPSGTGAVNQNVGYAGLDFGNDGQDGSGSGPLITDLNLVFQYTMNRNLLAGETVRMGVVLDSLNTTVIGATGLQVQAGSTGPTSATASVAAKSGVMDIYFFDLTNLSAGDTIDIYLANENSGNANWNTATLSGITFDSISPVPEPSSMAVLAIGGFGLLLRRRK